MILFHFSQWNIALLLCGFSIIASMFCTSPNTCRCDGGPETKRVQIRAKHTGNDWTKTTTITQRRLWRTLY